MTKTYQTKLPSDPPHINPQYCVYLAKLLNQDPSLMIRLQERKNDDYRSQVRFFSPVPEIMSDIKRMLGISTAIHKHDKNYLVTITKRSEVQRIMNALVSHLDKAAHLRATRLLEALSILDIRTAVGSISFWQSERLKDLARLLR